MGYINLFFHKYVYETIWFSYIIAIKCVVTILHLHHLMVVFICISPIMSEFEHLFICLKSIVFCFLKNSVTFPLGYWSFTTWFVEVLYILKKIVFIFNICCKYFLLFIFWLCFCIFSNQKTCFGVVEFN